MITVIGTLKSIPVIPHSVPQNDNAKIATKELMFSVLPMSFGSNKFPTKTWSDPTINKTIKQLDKSPNCKIQNRAGNRVPIKEPIVGM
tara:strand:+ start:233 stop:496 length:264 start_codon:yes stop_codon:yes gene_type:complete